MTIEGQKNQFVHLLLGWLVIAGMYTRTHTRVRVVYCLMSRQCGYIPEDYN